MIDQFLNTITNAHNARTDAWNDAVEAWIAQIAAQEAYFDDHGFYPKHEGESDE